MQLDTYGSEARKLHGKVSQSLQVDRARAVQLVEVLMLAFPGLLKDVSLQAN